MSLIREGRVWKFGDDINTDLIFPNRAMRAPLSEQYKFVFSANRPGWVDDVQAGDLIIGGKNFGMGSGRPSGRLFGECGIAGVVADSVNGLCLRNCVTYGFPALTVPGVSELFEEGERARIDYGLGTVENLDRPELRAVGTPLPQYFVDLVLAGGTLAMLVKEGYIDAQPHLSLST